jgi:NTE family protein
MHLRKGLPARGISPLGRNDEPLAPDTERGQIDYAVAPQVQDALARVRTDLDSFSEVEAYSLSLYGYRMASHELSEPATATYEWQLEGGAAEKLGAALASPAPALLKQLGVANKRFMKASALDGRVRAISAVAGLLVLGALGYLAYRLYEPATGDVPAWTLIVAVLLPTVLLHLYLKQKFRVKAFYWLADRLYTYLVPVLMTPFLWIGAKVILATNGAFLAAGRIERVTES